VRKLIAFFVLVTLLTGCKQSKDTPVAEAFHQKLYLSEVLKNTPFFASKEDSLFFMEQYIDDWMMKKAILAHAKESLSQKEQNFSAQLEQYKEQLLIHAFFQKMSQDSTLFIVTKEELAGFFSEVEPDDTPEYRDMVKLNYIKLSSSSKLFYKIKSLFFEETDRVQVIKQLELLCADTIEYYLDSENWFYTDFIENELPFSFSSKSNFDDHDKFEFVQAGYRYLVLILDKKRQLQPKSVFENRNMARALLQQQKKTGYFRQLQDSLIQKALSEKKAIRFGFTHN
jgi:hypothetical protein